MSDPRHVPGMVIPTHQLPPGFLETIRHEPEVPAEAKPAATVVLVRSGDVGPEVLLMKRNRTSGFVPGAFVFPGGRVDEADTDERLHAHVLGMHSAEPPFAYWIAAVREVFEETGVLLARTVEGAAPRLAELPAWRERLMADEATLLELLVSAALRLDLSGVVYCAHWITPRVEPRRFDTRFFLAALPPGQEAAADAREMSEAVWLTPAEALARFSAGTLPMVFPTVRTLESLCAHDSVPALLAAFEGREILPILPRLVRTERGVELVVEPEAR